MSELTKRRCGGGVVHSLVIYHTCMLAPPTFMPRFACLTWPCNWFRQQGENMKTDNEVKI